MSKLSISFAGRSSWLRLLAGVQAAACIGCAPTVVKLGGERPEPHRKSALPLVVAIDEIRGPDERFQRRWAHLGGGFATALLDANAFVAVLDPGREQSRADLLVRGTAEHEWRPMGASNFFTHFPGGLVFAPSWRGLRYELVTRASVDLVDPETGQVRGSYSAQETHRFEHRSANPFHFVGALLVIPAVIRGALMVEPRGRRRELTYDVAYADLWRDVASQMIADTRLAQIEPKPRHVGAGEGDLSLEECFDRCRDLTGRSRGECFDVCAAR